MVSREYETQKKLLKSWLVNELGYRYLGNLHDEYNDPVKPDLLRAHLEKAGYSDALIKRAIQRMVTLSKNQSMGLYALNKEMYSLLRYGDKPKETPNSKNVTVHYINWDDPEANDFAVAEEVTVPRNVEERNKRPDVVIYVNGIALGMFELKRSSVSAGEGIRQLLTNQKSENIPGFFSTEQLLFAGNESEGLFYGVIETPEKFYLQWSEDEKASNPLSLKIRELIGSDKNKLRAGVISLCQKERFLEMVENFMIFDAGRKKTARHNQFFANVAARKYIQNNEGGIIWNTQGSGKSLIMVWLTKWIIENIDNSRVVIITDREELDEQIKDLFFDVGETITRAKSGADLRDLLNKNEDSIICSLIHKYGYNAGKDSDIELYRKQLLDNLPADYKAKGHIVAFIDECHRTNSGKLHEAVRLLMPDATIIGFTGTPLLQKDKKTSLEVFGPYIHTYKFDEGVRDGVILDLRYEARDVDQYLSSAEKTDQWFEAKTAGLTECGKAQLKRSWATLSKLYSSKDRLQRIVADIMADMVNLPRLKQDRGTAMLVAGSIYEACRYYDLFTSSGFNKCAIVTSYVPSDSNVRTATSDLDEPGEAEYKESVYRRMLGGESIQDFETRVKEEFKKEPAKMKLLIVVDRLLTGFDAPSATYLYIDKSMRDHDLFQAICRVNRPDDDSKDYGFIVDYKDLFRSVQLVIDEYTSGAFDDYAKEDVDGLIKNRYNEAKAEMVGALHSLDDLLSPVDEPEEDAEYIQFFCGDSDDDAQTDENAAKRDTLYSLTGQPDSLFWRVL